MNRKKVINKICSSLIDRPNEWDGSIFELRKGDLSIWIANGFSGLKIESPVKISPFLWERVKLYRAINKFKVNKLNESLDYRMKTNKNNGKADHERKIQNAYK